jgi:hypothetical protein
MPRQTDEAILERIERLQHIIKHPTYGHNTMNKCKHELQTLQWVLNTVSD